jgi:hypothetical protein
MNLDYKFLVSLEF